MFQQGDAADDLFFIHTGKIKMLCDLNELIEDEKIFEKVLDYEKILIEAQTRGIEDAKYDKPSVKPILSYTEGGYFGDVDIFAEKLKYKQQSDGRDMSAYGEIDSSVFVLPRKELEKIFSGFRSIYNEMEHLAVKRFKYHQLLIARELRIYVTCAMQDEMSDDDIPVDDDTFENMSLSSENLHNSFKKQMEMLGNDIEMPGMKLLYELEGPEYLPARIDELQEIPNVLSNQKYNLKIATKKQRFD